LRPDVQPTDAEERGHRRRRDIQVHRTLATRTDAADLVRVGRVQALIASAAAVANEAAGEKRVIDLKMVERLTTLDACQVA
jgi:hypothetical protein